MNNHVTKKELATRIAIHTGRDKGSVEQFLQASSALVAEALHTGQEVEVKGLGVFKPDAKKEEDSVFEADSDFKDIVNKPFSFFEKTELNEGVYFPDLEEKEKNTQDDAEISSEKNILEEKTASESPISSDEMNQVLEPAVPALSETVESNNGESNSSVMWKIMVCVLVLVCISSVCYWIYSSSSKVPPEPANLEVEISHEYEGATQVADTARQLSIDTERSVTESEEAVKEIGRDTISRGDILTAIALKYYGHKIFWVYLFDYNQDVIKDPNNIPIGTEIRIPAPDVYNIDAHNAESRKKAALRQTEILSKK